MLLWQARMGLLKVLIRCLTGALVVRVCHTIQPVFDDPNLVAFGGLPGLRQSPFLACQDEFGGPGDVTAGVSGGLGDVVPAGES